MKCYNCNKEYPMWKALKEWEEEYGDEWMSQALINVMCLHCNTPTGLTISLDTYEETEEVESPIGTVKLPKI